jgi:hypothetical protein
MAARWWWNKRLLAFRLADASTALKGGAGPKYMFWPP